jgi:hypothetical protein
MPQKKKKRKKERKEKEKRKKRKEIRATAQALRKHFVRIERLDRRVRARR